MTNRKDPKKAQNDLLMKALERLDSIVTGAIETEELIDQANQLKEVGDKSGKFSDAYVNAFVSLNLSLYAAGRIPYDLAYTYISWIAESIRDDRCLAGLYADELSPINEQIDAIRDEYGLEDDEDWPQGEGPVEYQDLISQFDAVLDQKLVEAFVEFGAPEIGTEFTADQDEHYRKLENGLHAYLGEGSSTVEEPLSIKRLIETYEHDAELAFESGAFYAACALLGAALEAQLLEKCQREQGQVKHAISRLGSKQKPNRKDPLQWSLANLLNVCDAAGWLPILESRKTLHNLYDWGNIINRMRNTLHPGNHLRFVPFHLLGESDYRDAASIYLLIKNTLNDK